MPFHLLLFINIVTSTMAVVAWKDFFCPCISLDANNSLLWGQFQCKVSLISIRASTKNLDSYFRIAIPKFCNSFGLCSADEYCRNWGQWSVVKSCSSSCGNKEMLRKRLCRQKTKTTEKSNCPVQNESYQCINEACGTSSYHRYSTTAKKKVFSNDSHDLFERSYGNQIYAFLRALFMHERNLSVRKNRTQAASQTIVSAKSFNSPLPSNGSNFVNAMIKRKSNQKIPLVLYILGISGGVGWLVFFTSCIVFILKREKKIGFTPPKSDGARLYEIAGFACPPTRAPSCNSPTEIVRDMNERFKDAILPKELRRQKCFDQDEQLNSTQPYEAKRPCEDDSTPSSFSFTDGETDPFLECSQAESNQNELLLSSPDPPRQKQEHCYRPSLGFARDWNDDETD